MIRAATASDIDAIAAMRCALWPDCPLDESVAETRAIVAGTPASTLPLALFVAESDAGPAGFIEVGLRSHADGCDPAHPVGFVEGWYVKPSHRRRGVGRALLDAAESWARSHGCTELASDTWLTNEPSQHTHSALGFEEVDRVVTYKKHL